MGTVVKAFFGTLAALVVVVAATIVVAVVADPMGASILAFRLSQGTRPAAIPTPTEVPHIACDQGAQLVSARHSTTFALMQHYGPVTLSCLQPRQDGVLPVSGTWTYQGQSRSFTYLVSLQGVVTPSDDNAQEIDRYASLGNSVLGHLP